MKYKENIIIFMSVWENLIDEVEMYEYCMYMRQSRSYCSFDVVITLDSTVTTSYPPRFSCDKMQFILTKLLLHSEI